MSGIPYNELQTINCTAKKDDGESATIAVLHYAFVIPCRDCRWYGVSSAYAGWGCIKFEFGSWNQEPLSDGFCAWGERREQ